MTKTPEQLAEEYADSRLSGNGTYEYGMRQGFLAGYQAAKDTYKDAIDTYEDVAKQMLEEAVRIMSPKDQLAYAGKVMDACEHILDMDKMVDVNSSNNSNDWISVKERLPEEGIRCLVYTEWERIILSERIGDRWLMKEDDGQYERPAYWVTHWMPLPKPPKE